MGGPISSGGASGRPGSRRSRLEGAESLLAWDYNPVITKTIAFIKDVRSELSQVSWPTFGQLLDSTRVVLVTMVLLSAIIGLFDLVCARLISWIIR